MQIARNGKIQMKVWCKIAKEQFKVSGKCDGNCKKENVWICHDLA